MATKSLIGLPLKGGVNPTWSSKPEALWEESGTMGRNSSLYEPASALPQLPSDTVSLAGAIAPKLGLQPWSCDRHLPLRAQAASQLSSSTTMEPF